MPAGGGHGGPGLLRHGLGDGQLAHDLRLLAETAPSRDRSSGTTSTPGPGRQAVPSTSPWSSPSSWPSPRCGARSPTAPSSPSPSSASTSPTSSRPCCAACAGDSFQPGPWHLGKWSAVIGWVGIIWVGIITVLFVLPDRQPHHLAQLQLHDRRRRASCSLYATIFWFVSARKWFTGPRAQGDESALEAIENNLKHRRAARDHLLSRR